MFAAKVLSKHLFIVTLKRPYKKSLPSIRVIVITITVSVSGSVKRFGRSTVSPGMVSWFLALFVGNYGEYYYDENPVHCLCDLVQIYTKIVLNFQKQKYFTCF